MLTIAAICACSFISIATADCSIPPIYLNIEPQEVDGTKNSLSYGLSINVGTPIQQLSLWPSLDINETTLAGTDFCSTAPSSCTASSVHGLFDPSRSGSFTDAPPTNVDNTSTLTGSISTLSATGTDTLHLWSNLVPDTTPSATNLTHFPLQLLSNYTSPTPPFFGPAGLLGLGPSSTLLTSLHTAGKIASRSYGLFLGNAYARNNATASTTNPGSVNGSLTLGGYDAARFQQPVESFPISSGSSNSNSDPRTSLLTVPITAIRLSHSAPASNLLSAPFTAQLSTAQYELTLPSSLSAILSTTSNQPLTLTLGQNLTLTLTPSQLTTHPLTFSPTGPYILGTSLLQSLYLTVSHDSTPPVFFLAPSIPEPGYAVPAALCANDTPTPLDSAHLSDFVKNGLVGLILGVGIAGCAAGVVAIVVARRVWRGRGGGSKGRRKGQRQQQHEEVEMEMGYMQEEKEKKKSKGCQVRVVEKSREESLGGEEEEGQGMYFAPPPQRERKTGLKGILKVKIPGDGTR